VIVFQSESSKKLTTEIGASTENPALWFQLTETESFTCGKTFRSDCGRYPTVCVSAVLFYQQAESISESLGKGCT